MATALGALLALLVTTAGGTAIGAGVTATVPTVTTAPYAPPPTTPTPTPYPKPPPKPKPTPVKPGNPFAQRGLWIWELDKSNGGDVAEIIARAKATGVRTLMIKSSDGTGMWSQFTRALVTRLHRGGLKVCAWQFVYGDAPLGEAIAGARAVSDGADCLIIDAEGQYEGKYVAAQRYITALRHRIGAHYPVALAGLPYVDFHPAFPYSVFLGPGGAQYNAPQMYWRAIGTTTDDVFQHTYEFNVVYQRPIFPLGQVYDRPPVKQILRFRELANLYGAKGMSWWDWQEANPQTRYFHSIAQPVRRLAAPARATPATVAYGATGDLVVWAQEHLITTGARRLAIDGAFGQKTRAAVMRFQRAAGIPATGELDPLTWVALLSYKPVRVRWVARGRKVVAVAAGGVVAPVPSSASLPDRGRDLPPGLGAGSPR